MKKTKSKYRQVRVNLINFYGGRCQGGCGDNHSSKELQFAHVFPTGLHGKGRGSWKRLRDVLKFPFCYTLLCYKCHVVYDNPHNDN